jgi:hypothetical protein
VCVLFRNDRLLGAAVHRTDGSCEMDRSVAQLALGLVVGPC